MKEQAQKRLQELKAEFEAGQKMLADLEAQQSNLRASLLRISGAIQVLEELMTAPEAIENNSSASVEQQQVFSIADET